MIGQKQEAIELAQKTDNECSVSVDEISDGSYSPATMTLQVLTCAIVLSDAANGAVFKAV
jgi:hypothetical protein